MSHSVDHNAKVIHRESIEPTNNQSVMVNEILDEIEVEDISDCSSNDITIINTTVVPLPSTSPANMPDQLQIKDITLLSLDALEELREKIRNCIKLKPTLNISANALDENKKTFVRSVLNETCDPSIIGGIELHDATSVIYIPNDDEYSSSVINVSDDMDRTLVPDSDEKHSHKRKQETPLIPTKRIKQEIIVIEDDDDVITCSTPIRGIKLANNEQELNLSPIGIVSVLNNPKTQTTNKKTACVATSTSTSELNVKKIPDPDPDENGNNVAAKKCTNTVRVQTLEPNNCNCLHLAPTVLQQLTEVADNIKTLLSANGPLGILKNFSNITNILEKLQQVNEKDSKEGPKLDGGTAEEESTSANKKVLAEAPKIDKTGNSDKVCKEAPKKTGDTATFTTNKVPVEVSKNDPKGKSNGNATTKYAQFDKATSSKNTAKATCSKNTAKATCSKNTAIKDDPINVKTYSNVQVFISENIHHDCNFNYRGLKPIVIDGSNIAMSHGHGSRFSVRGLKICIDFFLRRGHKVYAFIPSYRLKYHQSDNPQLLQDLVNCNLVFCTSSWEVYGKKYCSYDDRILLQAAAAMGAVIVSRDNYRDLIREDSRFANIIRQGLLMPTWVGDMIIFPQDPLGRNGPRLNRFLSF